MGLVVLGPCQDSWYRRTRELATLGPRGTPGASGFWPWAERAWHDHPSERSEQNRPDSLPAGTHHRRGKRPPFGAGEGHQSRAPNARDGNVDGALSKNVLKALSSPGRHPGVCAADTAGKPPRAPPAPQVVQQPDFGDLLGRPPFRRTVEGVAFVSLVVYRQDAGL